MYVRLAFAVAAHLESEILIVDEVLAVGDAEFQKKCLGKMGDVTKGEGRTVLFVSHNMAAVQNLCDKGFVLENGLKKFEGTIHECIISYNSSTLSLLEDKLIKDRTDRQGKNNLLIQSFKICGNETNNLISIPSSQNFEIELFFSNKHYIRVNGKLLIGIYNFLSERILFFDTEAEGITINSNKDFSIKLQLPIGISLGLGRYSVNIAFFNNDVMEDYVQEAAIFEIKEDDFYNTGRILPDDTKFYTKNKWVVYEG
jgi:lipopolysaccharide transport system ATP-binding protein